MGVHGGNNIDSVLFQFIPDAFLMQGSPGGSSVVEGDGDAVISSSQSCFSSLERRMLSGETACSPSGPLSMIRVESRKISSTSA